MHDFRAQSACNGADDAVFYKFFISLKIDSKNALKMHFEAILDVDISVFDRLVMSYFYADVQNKLFSVRTLIFGLNFDDFPENEF